MISIHPYYDNDTLRLWKVDIWVLWVLFFFFFQHIYGLAGCLSMIVWTHAVLGVFYACVLYFCMCTCSAQFSLFHMETHSRNTIIVVIIIIIIIIIIIVIIKKKLPLNRISKQMATLLI